jgi:hypothetical protein
MREKTTFGDSHVAAAAIALFCNGVAAALRFLGYGACALAGTLWGTGFYWGRLALNEMSVEHMVLYRFLFACLGMLPVIALRQRVRLTRARCGPAAGRGLRHSHSVSAAVSRPGADHGEPRLADGGRHAGAAGRGRGAVCRRAARLDRLAGPLRSTAGAAMVVLGGRPRRPRARNASLAGDLLVIASLIVALAWILLSKS